MFFLLPWVGTICGRGAWSRLFAMRPAALQSEVGRRSIASILLPLLHASHATTPASHLARLTHAQHLAGIPTRCAEVAWDVCGCVRIVDFR